MITRALNALGLGKPAEHGSERIGEARPVETLEQHIMDVNVPKSDAEWWAKERIETLQARLDAERKAPVIDWEAKFKLAATDLAAQAEEIAAYKEGAGILHKAVTDRGVENERLTRGWEKCASDLKLVRRQLDDSEAELALMRPDAQKWRAYLKRSRDRRAGKAVKS